MSTRGGLEEGLGAAAGTDTNSQTTPRGKA